MRCLISLLTLLSAAVAIPDGLEIENLTPDVTCTRRTKSGDHIDVH